MGSHYFLFSPTIISALPASLVHSNVPIVLFCDFQIIAVGQISSVWATIELLPWAGWSCSRWPLSFLLLICSKHRHFSCFSVLFWCLPGAVDRPLQVLYFYSTEWYWAASSCLRVYWPVPSIFHSHFWDTLSDLHFHSISLPYHYTHDTIPDIYPISSIPYL